MSEKPEPEFIVGDVVEVIKVYDPKNNWIVGKRFQVEEVHWVALCRTSEKARWGYWLNNPAIPRRAFNGLVASFGEDQLRHPPKDEPTTFENCVWQPQKETA